MLEIERLLFLEIRNQTAKMKKCTSEERENFTLQRTYHFHSMTYRRNYRKFDLVPSDFGTTISISSIVIIHYRMVRLFASIQKLILMVKNDCDYFVLTRDRKHFSREYNT